MAGTSGWCQGGFCSLPPLSSASPSGPIPWVGWEDALPSLLPMMLTIHSSTPWADTKESRVLAGTIIVLLSSLCGFSAGFSSIYFDFSTKLNQICSEAYKNSGLSPLPPLHPYTHKSIHFHSFLSGGMRSQSAFFPWEHKLELLLLLHCSFSSHETSAFAPGCWNIFTIALNMQLIIHCCLWRRPEAIAVFSKTSPASSCKLNRQDRKTNKQKPKTHCSSYFTKVKKD